MRQDSAARKQPQFALDKAGHIATSAFPGVEGQLEVDDQVTGP
jgi:hypothetical protein